MTIVTVGIDLAKNVFAVHVVDATGKSVLVRPSVSRAKLLELIATLPACLIGMAACSGAHHGWRRCNSPPPSKPFHATRKTMPSFMPRLQPK